MKPIFKSALVAVFSLTAFTVNAQDLVRSIPANALAVISVKGKNLTDLVSVKELDTNFIGKKLLRELSGKSDVPYTSLNDLGFDLSGTYYYYNLTNDSVTFHNFLVPVKNAGKIDQIFKEDKRDFKLSGKVRTYVNQDATTTIYWDDEKFLAVSGSARSDYFSRPEVISRLGLSAPDSTNVLVDSVATVAVDEVGPPPAQEVYRPGKHKKTTSRHKKYKGKGKAKVKKGVKKPAKKAEKRNEIWVDQADTASDVVVQDSDSISAADYLADIDTNSTYYKDDKIKKAIVAAGVKTEAAALFSNTGKTSILDNKDYAKAIDQKAAATFWVTGIGKMYDSYFPAKLTGPLSRFSFFQASGFLQDYGSANTKIYLENKKIRLSGELTLSKERAESFKRINARKLNPKFLNYVNEDKLIGYFSTAVDTKAYLEEYPKMMGKVYGSLYADEIDMATDLFSLLLDEEAVSKVVKGDGVFIFNGLTQKEVSYKTYEYNEENFESKELTKTKKETMPDFLLMFSNEDSRLINKLIAYGVKKSYVKNNNRYYELTIPKSPIGLYFTIKDGIAFIGTNAGDMDQIANNTYQAKVSPAHKKALLNNNLAAYFSPKKLSGKIPQDETKSGGSLDKANRILKDLGDLYIQSRSIDGNVYSGEVSMDVPSDQKNALRYLFSLFENTLK